MSSDGILQPTRTTQGGCNCDANFQVCVEPCYENLRDHLLAWIDDFALYANDESQILDVLEELFRISQQKILKYQLPSQYSSPPR